MPNVAAAMLHELSRDRAVTAIVGAGLFVGHAPEAKPRPLVVIYESYGEIDHHQGGASDYVEAEYYVDCEAESYADAAALRDAARSALDGTTGTGIGPAGGLVHVLLTHVETHEYEFIADDDGGAGGIHRCRLEVRIIHRNT